MGSGDNGTSDRAEATRSATNPSTDTVPAKPKWTTPILMEISISDNTMAEPNSNPTDGTTSSGFP